MPVDAISLLLLFGMTVVIGYVGGALFHRTKIPDVVFLLVFGLLVGPLLTLVDKGLFIAVSPFLATLALLIILFDGGLNINFYQLIRNVPRSLLLSVLALLLSIVVVGLAATTFLGLPLIESFLLGAILSGTSFEVVSAVVNRMRISEKTKTLLNLESVINDPFTIIITLFLIGLLVPLTTTFSPLQSLASSFSIGGMVGLLLGLIWLSALDRLKSKPFSHMLTLAMAFLLYAFVEIAGGSGAIAALVFGLVLGNGVEFSKMLKFRKVFSIDKEMRFFQDEITFFIRSFFFVFLGLIAIFNLQYIIYGVLISALLIAVRWIAVEASTIGMAFTKMEKNIIRIMGPRALATAVMAQLPAVYGIPGAELYSSVAFVVIFVTVLYSSIATMIFYKPAKTREKTQKNKAGKKPDIEKGKLKTSKDKR